MKNDTEQLITYAAIAAGAYLVYKLTKPITETVGGVGSGIVTATQGAGEGVSEVLTGTSSPFEFLDQYLESKQRTQETRENAITILYKTDPEVLKQLKEITLLSEENKKNILEELFKSMLHNLMTAKIRVNHLEIEDVKAWN